MAIFESDVAKQQMAPMREAQRRAAEHVNVPIPELRCDTAREFWNLLEPKQDNKYIYRGLGSTELKLTPKALRLYDGKRSFLSSYIAQSLLTVEMQIVQEAHLLRCFVDYCDATNLPILGDSVEWRDRTMSRFGLGVGLFQLNPAEWPNNDWLAVMALAQHHGLPTRLLDWSRRSYIATYFAASDALKNRGTWKADSRLVVWSLKEDLVEGLTTRPRSAVSQTNQTKRRSSYPHPELIPYIRVLALPGATSAHLSAQSGLFTLQKESGGGRDILKETCLEDDPASGMFLEKFTLPVTEASNLIEICKAYNITASTLFRSYDGAAAAVMDDTRVWSEMPLGTNPKGSVVKGRRVPAAKIALIGPSGSGTIRQLEIRYGSSLNRNMDQGLDTATPQAATTMLNWMRNAPPGFVSVSAHKDGIEQIAKVKRDLPDSIRDIFFIYLYTEPAILKRRLAELGIPGQVPDDELLVALSQIADMTIDTSYFTPEETRSNIDAALVQAGVLPI
jgi:hypothetical protein